MVEDGAALGAIGSFLLIDSSCGAGVMINGVSLRWGLKVRHSFLPYSCLGNSKIRR